MRVWVLAERVAYEGDRILGIFSTQEAADAERERQQREDPPLGEYRSYEVDAYTLDEVED